MLSKTVARLLIFKYQFKTKQDKKFRSACLIGVRSDISGTKSAKKCIGPGRGPNFNRSGPRSFLCGPQSGPSIIIALKVCEKRKVGSVY